MTRTPDGGGASWPRSSSSMPMIAASYAGGCATTRFPLKPGADETEKADPRRKIG
jgi:hypothetical protein